MPAPSRARPRFIEPELATLVSDPPEGDGWLHEIKFDGYRMECLVADGRARLLTRRGLDWTDRFPRIADEAASLPVKQAVLDGEIVALLADGRSSFQALQQALLSEQADRLVYYTFDLLWLEQEDLRPLPLRARKARLARLLKGRRRALRSLLRYTEHRTGSAAGVLRQACRKGLEGIVSKRADAPYRSGRGRSWLKLKCLNRQEFVVVGFTEPRGGRQGIGALLLGVYERGKLRYAGKVGTGMGMLLLRALRATLEPLRRAASPVRDKPARGLRGVHWVEPRVVVEVAFTEWTADGRLRHPTVVGVREDKPARQVRRE